MSQLPRQVQEFVSRMDCDDLDALLDQLKSKAHSAWKSEDAENADWKNIYLALEKAHRLVSQRSGN